MEKHTTLGNLDFGAWDISSYLPHIPHTKMNIHLAQSGQIFILILRTARTRTDENADSLLQFCILYGNRGCLDFFLQNVIFCYEKLIKMGKIKSPTNFIL